MHYLSRQIIKAILLICFVTLVTLKPITADARLVRDVTIDTLADGYDVTIYFECLIRYQSLTPNKTGDYFQIEVRPINLNKPDEQDIESLRERRLIGWDRRTGVPIKEITYEGDDPDHPQITFVFTKVVEYEVRGSSDLKSIVVRIKTKPRSLQNAVNECVPENDEESVVKAIGEELSEAEKISEEKAGVISTEEPSPIRGEKPGNLMEMAKVAMTEGNYSRAIQIYTKILKTAEGDSKKQAQEFLGLARERNGQFAHAKSEYEKYLKDYPEGSDAVRVRQRLAGLVTASKKPKERTVEVKHSGKIVKKPEWQIRNYGNYSNFFFRNQTFQKDGETRVSRNDVYTNIDLNSRWSSENFDMRSKYTGRHQHIFMPEMEGQAQLSALSFEIRHKKSDLFGKIGRQSRNSGGVLGRFDGIHLSYDVASGVAINGVFGFPVDSTVNTNVETAKKFYGISVDLGTFKEHWDYNVFFITQDNSGVTDRCAIGGEVRYFDPKKSFFTLVDYDVFFNAMNIFLFNGNWTLSPETTLNVICDYRRSPLLMTTNAVQGQGVEKLEDLFGEYTDDELKMLAEDRSAISKSFTFGVTQKLRDNIQLAGDFALSRTEGTEASGGVDAMPGTGNDYYCSMQLICNNIFFENDSIINGIRYSDTDRNNTYTYNISARFPVAEKFRITPRFRIDYRDRKDNDDRRLTMRPQVSIDYRLRKSTRLEIEGGAVWTNDYSSGISSKSTEIFISAGYRITF